MTIPFEDFKLGAWSKDDNGQLDIDRIQNVNTKQGFYGRILNFGDIEFDTAGSDMSNGSANSPTVAALVASRARIARRVGSASAEKV